MKTVYDRTRMLIGEDALETLRQSSVVIFGIGGVGGFVVEALARTGVGTIGIVDSDRVDVTNINRQIIALQNTVGRLKTEVMEERIAAINPATAVHSYPCRLTAENIASFHLEDYDYVVDAIDDVPAKLVLIAEAHRLGKPVVCCMGTGNKLDPQRLRIAPIEKTHTCPLARRIRKELRLLGIRGVSVVFSDEEPGRAEYPEEGGAPASVSFVPAAAGMLLASKVVRDLIESRDGRTAAAVRPAVETAE